MRKSDIEFWEKMVDREIYKKNFRLSFQLKFCKKNENNKPEWHHSIEQRQCDPKIE